MELAVVLERHFLSDVGHVGFRGPWIQGVGRDLQLGLGQAGAEQCQPHPGLWSGVCALTDECQSVGGQGHARRVRVARHVCAQRAAAAVRAAAPFVPGPRSPHQGVAQSDEVISRQQRRTLEEHPLGPADCQACQGSELRDVGGLLMRDDS